MYTQPDDIKLLTSAAMLDPKSRARQFNQNDDLKEEEKQKNLKNKKKKQKKKK